MGLIELLNQVYADVLRKTDLNSWPFCFRKLGVQGSTFLSFG
jgi:hypothetical protein